MIEPFHAFSAPKDYTVATVCDSRVHASSVNTPRQDPEITRLERLEVKEALHTTYVGI